MPQAPDPYALHDATLAELRLQQQAAQAAGERPSSTPTNARSARRRVENRAEGATNVFGSASGAIYDLAALVLSIGWFVVKWTLILGTKLFAGMSNAAHWVMHEVTGGD